MTDQIWTPKWLCERLVKKAYLVSDISILEPIISKGHLAQIILEHLPENSILEGIEISSKLAFETNKKLNISVFNIDFLEFNQKYDRIIASPPFTKKLDIRHMYHMYD